MSFKKKIGEFFKPRNALARGVRVGGAVIGGSFGGPMGASMGYKVGDKIAGTFDKSEGDGGFEDLIMRGKAPAGTVDMATAFAGGMQGGGAGGGDPFSAAIHMADSTGDFGGGQAPGGAGGAGGAGGGMDFARFLPEAMRLMQNKKNGIGQDGGAAPSGPGIGDIFSKAIDIFGKGGGSAAPEEGDTPLDAKPFSMGVNKVPVVAPLPGYSQQSKILSLLRNAAMRRRAF